MLTGLGLGPGDPELLTLKAVKLLKEADNVFVPGGLARKLVDEYCSPIELSFPMSHDEELIRSHIIKNADIIAEYAAEKDVIFGLIGDPNIFSTFSRLVTIMKERHPAIEIKTVPGISSVTAIMSEINMAITGGFSVTDGAPVRSQIRMKVKKPKEIAETLRKDGYTKFALVERMYMNDMKIFMQDELPDRSSYFSLLYAEREE